MRVKLPLLLVLFSIAALEAGAQKIVDSVKVYNFPVREGVVHFYEPRSVHYSFNSMPIMNVMSAYDSVFHFEPGVVTDVRKVGEVYAVCIENKKKDIVVYSNLLSTSFKKGDKVKRGSFLGRLDRDYDDACHEVDILIFQKGEVIPFNRILDYLRRNISTAPPASQTL